MSTKRLQEVQAEKKLISDQLEEIENLAEPDGDEALRAQIITERDTKVDDLIARFKELEEEEGPLLKRAQQLADVRAAARDIARVEPGDGARYLGGTGPAVHKKVDPFEGDLLRLPAAEVVTRARTLIETEKRVHISDASRERLDDWVQRAVDDDDTDPDFGFDGGYIGRRMLLTEKQVYRSAFRKYVAGRDAFNLSAPEMEALSDFARFERFEIRRSLSENTTTAGGFGVPVKLAA